MEKCTENAYVLTPATNTVINMPNAVVDPTIEGSVVRIEEDVETSVKKEQVIIFLRN